MFVPCKYLGLARFGCEFPALRPERSPLLTSRSGCEGQGDLSPETTLSAPRRCTAQWEILWHSGEFPTLGPYKFTPGSPRGPERSGTETRRLASSLHLLKLIWGSFLGVLPRVFVNVTWQACELQATSPEAHAGEPGAGRSVPAPPSVPTCSPPVLQTGGL